MSDIRDSVTFHQPITAAASSSNRIPQFVEIPITFAEIAALGLTDPIYYDDLPANVRIDGVHAVVTTALGFSSTDTTGVSMQVGRGADPDAFGGSVALAGTAGYRLPAPGVLLGGALAGGAEGVSISFTPTGPAASLAHLNAGALKVIIDFVTL